MRCNLHVCNGKSQNIRDPNRERTNSFSINQKKDTHISTVHYFHQTDFICKAPAAFPYCRNIHLYRVKCLIISSSSCRFCTLGCTINRKKTLNAKKCMTMQKTEQRYDVEMQGRTGLWEHHLRTLFKGNILSRLPKQ